MIFGIFPELHQRYRCVPKRGADAAGQPKLPHFASPIVTCFGSRFSYTFLYYQGMLYIQMIHDCIRWHVHHSYSYCYSYLILYNRIYIHNYISLNITIYHYISLYCIINHYITLYYIIIYHYILFYIIIYHYYYYKSLYLIISHYISLYIIILYHHISLYIIVYHCISLCIIIYHYISLYIIIYHYISWFISIFRMSYLSGYRLPRFLGLVLPSSAAPSRPRPREGNGELAPKSGHDMLVSIGNLEV